MNHIRQNTLKISVVLMVMVYLIFSVGVIKATHFCMGREASVSFFTSETKKCACSIYAGEKDDCCDDEQSLIRLENEQKVVSNFTMAVPVWFQLEYLFTERLIASLTTDSKWEINVKEAPPPKIPLWKFQCSYVFYDDELIG